MLLLTALGNAYLGKRDCARAQGLYTRVLKIRPFLDGALIGSARCHLENKRVTTAVQFLERAVKSNPESAEAHFLLARTIESSERERAVVYFSRYLELTKDSAKAFRREREVAKQSVARAR
jgi:tetratricopeptide (TPR) repeat protein